MRLRSCFSFCRRSFSSILCLLRSSFSFFSSNFSSKAFVIGDPVIIADDLMLDVRFENGLSAFGKGCMSHGDTGLDGVSFSISTIASPSSRTHRSWLICPLLAGISDRCGGGKWISTVTIIWVAFPSSMSVLSMPEVAPCIWYIRRFALERRLRQTNHRRFALKRRLRHWYLRFL